MTFGLVATATNVGLIAMSRSWQVSTSNEVTVGKPVTGASTTESPPDPSFASRGPSFAEPSLPLGEPSLPLDEPSLLFVAVVLVAPSPVVALLVVAAAFVPFVGAPSDPVVEVVEAPVDASRESAPP